MYLQVGNMENLISYAHKAKEQEASGMILVAKYYNNKERLVYELSVFLQTSIGSVLYKTLDNSAFYNEKDVLDDNQHVEELKSLFPVYEVKELHLADIKLGDVTFE